MANTAQTVQLARMIIPGESPLDAGLFVLSCVSKMIVDFALLGACVGFVVGASEVFEDAKLAVGLSLGTSVKGSTVTKCVLVGMSDGMSDGTRLTMVRLISEGASVGVSDAAKVAFAGIVADGASDGTTDGNCDRSKVMLVGAVEVAGRDGI